MRDLRDQYRYLPPFIVSNFSKHECADSEILTSYLLTDADIVCSRAKNHYDPEENIDLSESATQLDNPATTSLENFRNLFKKTHDNMARTMYFS